MARAYGRVTGKEFRGTLLFVQNEDETKCCEISFQNLCRCFPMKPLLDWYWHGNPNMSNSETEAIKMFQSSKNLRITDLQIYSGPLTEKQKNWRWKTVFIHTFVVFKTISYRNGITDTTWWSIEKNAHHILLQKSQDKNEIRDYFWDALTNKFERRLEPIKMEIETKGHESLEHLLEALLKDYIIIDPYHLYLSNCQQFAFYVYKKIKIDEVGKWTPPVRGYTFKHFFMKRPRRSVINDYFLSRNGERKKAIQAIISENPFEFNKYLKHCPAHEIDAVDCQGYTLLDWTEAFNRKKMKEDLREKGASITDNQNAFFIALQYWEQDKRDALSAFGKINYDGVNEMGDSVLHLALYGLDNTKEKTNLVDKLLKKKCIKKKCDEANEKDETPLHLATKLKCPTETFKQILKVSNKVNDKILYKKDSSGYTALDWAVVTHSESKTKILLEEYKSDYIKVTDADQTPIHLAAKWWNDCPADIIKKFLEFYNINILDKRNFTALQWALESKHEKVCRILLEEGASMIGTTPSSASKGPNIPIAEATIEKSKSEINNEEAIQNALNNDEVKIKTSKTSKKTNYMPHLLAAKWTTIPATLAETIIEKTIAEGIQVDEVDKYGYTPLHWTFKVGSMEMAIQLLKNKVANYKKTTKDGEYTIVHLMAQSRNYSTENDKFFRRIYELIGKDEFKELLAQRDKKGYLPLHTAVESDNLFAVRNFLTLEADINSTVKKAIDESLTPLHIATQNPTVSVALVKELIEKGANINAVHSCGFTALLWALKRKSEEKVCLLLEKGAEVNVDITAIKKPEYRKTPLQLASEWTDCSPKIFETILRNCKKQQINEEDPDGYTPLQNCVRFSMKNHTRMLLDEGEANIKCATKDKGYTLLHLLAENWRNCSEDLFDMFLENSRNHRAKANTIEQALQQQLTTNWISQRIWPFFQSTFHWVLRFTPTWLISITNFSDNQVIDQQTQETLIHNEEQKVIINTKDKKGYTPLHLAIAENQSVTICKKLLKCKADGKAKTNEGYTSLHLIAQKWSDCPENLFTFFFESVNEQDKKGYTPLHYAIESKSQNLVEKLLKHDKTNVNAKTHKGFTPLHLLAQHWNRSQGIIKKLLKHPLANVDAVNAKDNEGYTALLWAIANTQSIAVCKKLLDCGADKKAKTENELTLFHLLAKNKCAKDFITKDLIKMFYNKTNEDEALNAQDKEGYTPLHLAIESKNFDFAKTLLVYKANVSKTTEKGLTPLHLLAQNWSDCQEDFIKKLLGSNETELINSKDNEGYTPLHRAIESKSIGIANKLLVHGADAKSRTNKNFTMLHLLAQNWSDCHEDLIRKLLGSNETELINAKDNEGYTPLHRAIEAKSKGLVKTFLKYKASVDKITNEGFTPQVLAGKIWNDCPRDVFETLSPKLTSVTPRRNSTP